MRNGSPTRNLASLADETPEGAASWCWRSSNSTRGAEWPAGRRVHPRSRPDAHERRTCGARRAAGAPIRKGAAEAMPTHVEAHGGRFPAEESAPVDDVVRAAARRWW